MLQSQRLLLLDSARDAAPGWSGRRLGLSAIRRCSLSRERQLRDQRRKQERGRNERFVFSDNILISAARKV